MIEQLPAHSRYAEAIAGDRELAAESLYDDPDPTPPPVSSWTPEMAELRIISERLGHVGALLAVLSKNRYEPPSLPRPVTARRELWLERNLAGHRRRVARMLPPPPDEEVADAVPG